MEQNPHRRAKIRLQEGELILEYTKNYHLNQWEPTDRVLREDFNEDNRKIEEALGKKVEIVLGTYTGNSTTYTSSQNIVLGWKPKAILVFAVSDANGKLDNLPAQLAIAGESSSCISITDTGFTVYNELNRKDLSPFRYWAIQ